MSAFESDLRNLAAAWHAVGEFPSPSAPNDPWERGYRAALRSCAERLDEVFEENIEDQHADAVRRGVTS